MIRKNTVACKAFESLNCAVSHSVSAQGKQKPKGLKSLQISPGESPNVAFTSMNVNLFPFLIQRPGLCYKLKRKAHLTRTGDEKHHLGIKFYAGWQHDTCSINHINRWIHWRTLYNSLISAWECILSYFLSNDAVEGFSGSAVTTPYFKLFYPLTSLLAEILACISNHLSPSNCSQF